MPGNRSFALLRARARGQRSRKRISRVAGSCGILGVLGLSFGGATSYRQIRQIVRDAMNPELVPVV
jgi:hypothetical protein